MDIFNAPIVFIVSLMAGFMGGQVGGGGLLTLPVLLLIGLNPLIALGTNRFAALFSNFISAVIFYREKKILLKDYLIFGFVALIGGLIGVFLVINFTIDSVTLKKLIAVV